MAKDMPFVDILLSWSYCSHKMNIPGIIATTKVLKYSKYMELWRILVVENSSKNPKLYDIIISIYNINIFQRKS